MGQFIILLMAFFRTSLGHRKPGSFADVLGKLDSSMGGLLFIFVGIGLTSGMGMARLSRGLVLSARETTYVEAARATGARTPWIIRNHILPNIIGPLVVAETLSILTYISYEACLSFIGLGVNPPTPSWGGTIAEGAQISRHTHSRPSFQRWPCSWSCLPSIFWGTGCAMQSIFACAARNSELRKLKYT